MSINNSFTSLESIINAKRNCEIGVYDLDGNYLADGDYFNVYWEKGSDKFPELSDIVYVGENEEVDDDLSDDDWELALIPQAVKDKGWWLSISGENLESVVMSAIFQKKNVSNDEIIKAINYYLENDCFMTFED